MQSERLDRLLLTAQELEAHDPLGNLYDLAWNAFADLESGNPARAASVLVDFTRYPSIATESFLYDFRNAVGAMTNLYVARRAGSGSFSPRIAREVLSVVKGLRWHDKTGEVLLAYSLLLMEVSPKKEEIAELVEACSKTVKESLPNLEQLARDAKDVSFCLLALSYLEGNRLGYIPKVDGGEQGGSREARRGRTSRNTGSASLGIFQSRTKIRSSHECGT